MALGFSYLPRGWLPQKWSADDVGDLPCSLGGIGARARSSRTLGQSVLLSGFLLQLGLASTLCDRHVLVGDA